MITITPFEGEFCNKTRTIYSINNTKPYRHYGSVTTSAECPHCGEKHIFRLYEAKKNIETDTEYKDIYDCICPKCNKLFDIVIEDVKED